MSMTGSNGRTTPDPEIDTLSPIYDGAALPEGWPERLAGGAMSPVHWTRSAANPVIAAGMNARPIRLSEDVVRVYYGVRGQGGGVHYVDVAADAPERILAGPVGPIVSTGEAGSFDDDWVLCPEPVRVSATHLRLYYAAKSASKAFFSGAWSLGLAESHDNGATWQKHPENPIMTATGDGWECGAVGFCSVLPDGDGWRMWYLGTDDVGGLEACKQVGYATSADGVHWQRHAANPVLPADPDVAWERRCIAVPRVIQVGPLLKVWYCCYEYNDTYAIGQAESLDGITWRRSPHNPVVLPSGAGWDSQMTEYPGVIRVGDRYLMWYSGDGYGSAGIGLATAPAPTGELLWRSGPTATPDPNWSAWQPVAEQPPARTGYLQWAVCGAPAQPLDLATGTLADTTVDARGRLRLAADDAGYRAAGSVTSAVIDGGAPSDVALTWREQWNTPQRWEKHAGNPIFGPPESGDWDQWTNGVAILRTPDGLGYRMYYAGRKGGGIGFAEASVADPLTWTPHPANPVLRPRADNWEGNMINQPRVVKVTAQHWRMYYTGWGLDAAGGGWAIGLAESFDAGVTWARHSGEVLIPRGGPDSPDGAGVFVPEVHYIDGQWRMWYTAMRLAEGRQSIHICHATSHDGITWVKDAANPVLTDDFETGPSRNVISRCCVRYERGVYGMWYSHAKPDYRIRYAESTDGIHWEHSPIHLALDAAPAPAWDDQMVEYPTIDVVDGEWRLWFCGNGFGSVGFATGIVETGLSLSLRHGPTAVPDASWSDWQPIAHAQWTPAARYRQIRADIRSENPKLSPALDNLHLHQR